MEDVFECVDVRVEIDVGDFFDLFGRYIEWCFDELSFFGVKYRVSGVVVGVCDPEVRDHGVFGRGDHDVGRFQVVMDHVRFVCCFEIVCDLYY